MSTPIMRQYNELKNQHKDCLLFFRLGDFYELFFEDAKVASEILGITLTKRVQKDETIPMAGVPAHTSNYYIAKLIKAGKKIAICEQVETSEDKQNKIIKREVVRIVTNGTIYEDNLLNSNRNNFLISFFSSNFLVGAACLDISTNEFFINTIEPQYIKDYIAKYEPAEILLNQEFIAKFDYTENKEIITFVDPINQKKAEDLILSFYKIHSLSSVQFQNLEELIATALIINYIKFTHKNRCNESFFPIPKRQTDLKIMMIDNFTKRNLEIAKTLQNEHKGSLLWLLDSTKTHQGSRLLFKIIHEPLACIEKIKERLTRVRNYTQNKNLQKIRTILKNIPDFERLSTKIIQNNKNIETLFVIANGIDVAMQLNQYVDQKLTNLSKIAEKIQSIIKFDESFFIDANVNPIFEQLKARKLEIEEIIVGLEISYRQSYKIMNIRIKWLNDLGYVIETNPTNKEKLSYNCQLIQELKNVCRFVTPTLEEINKNIASINTEIAEQENCIIKELAKEIITYIPLLKEYSNVTAEIDVFTNFATFALENNFVEPEMTEGKDFNIIGGRHPILDYIFRMKGKTFVANDCDLAKYVIFMTGPNMAGKSTYLKQQALIVFLAHIGMFVPANKATIGIVDYIFSRIGASDNLLEGISTFMMEMIEIGLTLNYATDRSFIIFDEVGRGTSAEEGIVIAQAVLEHIAEKLRARTLFSTHYLKLQSIESYNIQKKMMETKLQGEDIQIHFTYKVIDGCAEKTYALAIAKIAGLPHSVVERACQLYKNCQSSSTLEASLEE